MNEIEFMGYISIYYTVNLEQIVNKLTSQIAKVFLPPIFNVADTSNIMRKINFELSVDICYKLTKCHILGFMGKSQTATYYDL